MNNIKEFFKKHEIKDISTREITQKAFEAGVEVLTNDKYNGDKTRILLAFSNKEPSAILVGNVLKSDKKGNLHYTSRKNRAKRETELDALATWNNKIPGEGKAILCEYFYTLLNDGFKKVFVRSEIPEYSFAVECYKKMVFKPLSENIRNMQRQT